MLIYSGNKEPKYLDISPPMILLLLKAKLKKLPLSTYLYMGPCI